MSVINGATCNGTDTGCSASVANVNVASHPTDIAVDEATDTVYVTNQFGSVSVINGAECNGTDFSGCVTDPVSSIAVNDPLNVATYVAVDESTDTVYVTMNGVVSVIDGALCNGTQTSGCGDVAPTTTTGLGDTNWIAVSETSDTVYVLGTPNGNSYSLSMINGRLCNGVITSGCGSTPASMALPTNNGGYGLAVDDSTDTLYVGTYVGTGTDRQGTVLMFNGNTCNGDVQLGCSTPSSVNTGQPLPATAMAVDQSTEAVYVTDFGADFISVINGTTCNAQISSGCGNPPTTMTLGGGSPGIAVNRPPTPCMSPTAAPIPCRCWREYSRPLAWVRYLLRPLWTTPVIPPT